VIKRKKEKNEKPKFILWKEKFLYNLKVNKTSKKERKKERKAASHFFSK
jgi:hypothetical protein